jgi:hypothetical protein
MRWNLDLKSRLWLPDPRYGMNLQLFGGNTYNESFEGAGYENVWSETVGEGNTLDEDSAGPGSLPTGAGSQCLRSYQAGTNPHAYATGAIGSTMPTVFFRVYFYIDAFTQSDFDECSIFHLLGYVLNVTVAVRYTAIYGYHLKVKCYDGGNVEFIKDDQCPLDLDTWYRLEGKYSSVDDICEIRLDGEVNFEYR